MTDKFLQEIIRLARVPLDNRSDWVNGALESAAFLKSNHKSNKIILYLSGRHFFARTALVNKEKVTPPDKEDLYRSEIRTNDTWCIERAYGGGNDHRIYLAPPMSAAYGQTLKDAENLVIIRNLEGVERPKLPIELNQKLVHSLSLHHLEERDAFCRLDSRGDIEDVIKIHRDIAQDSWDNVQAVTILANELATYMALTNTALFCRFDATRFIPGYFDMWDDSDDIYYDEPDIYYRSKVMKNKASFVNGWLIHRTELTEETMVEEWQKEKTKQKEYATFIIIDRKNDNKVIETSCGPEHIVNYFQDSTLPWEISPAFFRPEVLQKYKSDPEKYTSSDRSISCRNSWHLPTYDTNEAGQVHTYIGYLADLPYEEQMYWKLFNEEPKAGISERAYQTDILGQVSEVRDPLIEIKICIQQLDEKAPIWWKPRGKELIDTVLYPATDSISEWGKEIIALDQMVVEGFLAKEFKKMAKANNAIFDNNLASLKMIEVYLTSLGWEQNEASDTVTPLHELHKLRSKLFAHGNPKEKAELARKARGDHKTLRAHFTDLSSRILDSLHKVRQALPN